MEKDFRDTIFENEKAIEDLFEKYGIPQKDNVQTVDAGKARFEEKFGVLKKYKQFFIELTELNEMAENIKSVLKANELSISALQIIELEYEKISFDWVKQIFYDINNRLQIEHAKCGIEQKPILCSSDIVESIFGKFKMKTNQVVGGTYETVLSIPLFCGNLTNDLTTRILTKVKMADVDNWFRQMVGVSNLAKRRIAFSKPQ